MNGGNQRSDRRLDGIPSLPYHWLRREGVWLLHLSDGHRRVGVSHLGIGRLLLECEPEDDAVDRMMDFLQDWRAWGVRLPMGHDPFPSEVLQMRNGLVGEAS